jgi:hypothetical protein|tara:strand:- start:2 stop:235 length:234 start_codon:yes stop_codon:yes gene_type:complete
MKQPPTKDEKIEILEQELLTTKGVLKSETLLNKNFKETIEKQEIVMQSLREVIDDLLSKHAKLRLKLKENSIKIDED